MRTTVLFMILTIVLVEILHVCSQKCPKLASPKHGRVRIRARGRLAKFRCWRKYTLVGPKIIICSGNKWSLRPPICVRKGCDTLESTGNMTVTPSTGGAVLTFKCIAPLKLTGDKILTCDGKKWSAPAPVCEYEEPGLSCDFEDENLCGWQHDSMANFKWKWTSGTTPTRRTGPTYDHTLGKGKNGHYMYMESSSPIKKYDKARLQSPYFAPTTGSECFDFWYHMWGQAGPRKVGNLKIYTEEMGAVGSLKEEFSISGNQGELWLRGKFSLGKRKKSFRFVIEGQKLDSYLSDISVDDVRLYNCSEDYVGTTTSYDETSETEMTVLPTKQTASVTIITSKKQRPTTDSIVVTSASQLTKLTTSKFTHSTTQSTKTTSQTTSKSMTTANVPKINSTTERETTQTTQTTTKIVTKEKTTRKTRPPTTTMKITKKVTVKPTTTTTTIKPSSSTPKPTTTAKPTTTIPTTLSTQPTTTTMVSSTTKSTTTTTLPTTSSTITTRRTKAKTTAPTSTKPSTTRPSTTTTTTILPSTSASTTKTSTTTKEMTTKPTTKSTAKFITVTTKTTKSTTISPKPVKSTQPITTAPMSRSTKGTTTLNERVSVGTTVNMSIADNSTDYSNLNVSTTKSPVLVKPAERSDGSPVKPLMIGVGVGIAIGLIIVIGAIYIYLKRRRKDDIFEDEMEPIAKNAVYD